MVTGYTAKLHDGEMQTTADFILSCSRAFGALIHQRDESMDNRPRLREPDTSFYEKALAKARAELVKADGWTEDEATKEAKRVYEENLEQHVKSEKKRQEIKNRYESMLERVKEWQPPTPGHQGLKEFMVEQLESSIKFDCTPYRAPTHTLQTGAEYKAERIAQAEQSVRYYLTQIADEEKRVESANKWITDLYNSLPDNKQ